MKKKRSKKISPKKQPPLKIELAIYRRSVVVFFESTIKEVVDWGLKYDIEKEKLNINWQHDIELLMKNNVGCASEFGEKNSDIMVWVKKRPRVAGDYGCLYHELYHAVEFIAARCDPGEYFNDRHGMSEPRAYLFEYLVDECNRALWPSPMRKRKIKVFHKPLKVVSDKSDTSGVADVG